MRIAVTGASGFIGRHVLAQLGTRNVSITAVIGTGGKIDATAPADNIVQLDIHEVDSGAYELLGRPDVLIHLAWSGLPNYDSLHHFERELPGHYRFLRQLIDAGLPSLVVAGTCFEYGMQSGGLSESLEPCPSNPYGYAKDALRRQLTYLQRQTPFRMAWARLFYLYGSGQNGGSLWSQLKVAAERGDAQFNMSGGEQLRDYLPVEKAAEYLVALALLQQSVGVINLCSGVPLSVRSLVEGWILVNGWSIKPNLGYYSYPSYEPMAFWGDALKLHSLLEII